MASGAPEPVILDILRDEFERWRHTLPPSVIPKFRELPYPEGAGRVVRVTVETPTHEAEATMWESGDTDGFNGNMAVGEIEAIEHMELTTRLGARGLLQDLAQAIGA